MSLRLLTVLAHPDDESLGFGGTLAPYAGRHFGGHRSSIGSTARSTVEESSRPIFLKGYGERVYLLLFESSNSNAAPLLSR